MEQCTLGVTVNNISPRYLSPPSTPLINLRLPPEILTFTFSKLPLLGAPTTLLICKQWTFITKRQWESQYPIPLRACNGGEWLKSASKMKDEGFEHHAFFYAIKIHQLFLQKIERPISPCTMHLFQNTHPILNTLQSKIVGKALKELSSVTFDQEISEFFWRSFKKACTENNLFLLFKILFTARDMISEDDLKEIYDCVKNKVLENPDRLVLEVLNRWISQAKLNEIKDYFPVLAELITISSRRGIAAWESEPKFIKSVAPRPHVFIACLPEDSDDSSCDAESGSDSDGS